MSKSVGFNLGVPGFVLGRVGFQWFHTYDYGHTWGKAKGDTFNLTPTTGRLTQGTRDYLEYQTDVDWRITVTARDKNLAGGGELHYRTSLIKVKHQASVLRREQAAPG